MELTEITDALRAAQRRRLLPTSLGTAELRELGEEILAGSVFTARGTNAVFVSRIKEVVDLLAAGEINEATARLVLLDTLRAIGYTPEGGFPDAPAGSVPPALAGTLQDLSSKRRLDLIVETQRGLMIGAGQQMRGSDPDRLRQFPAWELVRQLSVAVPRDWQARWMIAGGTLSDGRMVALKGHPVWGELGSYGNFEDALGVDHPPFAFNSGMGWEEISDDEAEALGLTGPDGESPEKWLQSQPPTLAGKQSLPAPVLSLKNMDPALVKLLEKGAVRHGDEISLPRGEEDLKRRAAERKVRQKERSERAIREAQEAYERRRS